MKFLTYDESQRWFSSIRLTISNNRRYLQFPSEYRKIISTIPKHSLPLLYLAGGLVSWLSGTSERMIWVTNWDTDPPAGFNLFKKVRLGFGGSSPLIETPGHLFQGSSEEEDTIMAGIIFLIMALNWEAEIVVERPGDCIYLGDEHLSFHSKSEEKIRDAKKLVKDHKLEVVTDIKNAWK